MENLHIIGLESKLFFTGDKLELAQITGGKDINPMLIANCYEYFCVKPFFSIGVLFRARLVSKVE